MSPGSVALTRWLVILAIFMQRPGLRSTYSSVILVGFVPQNRFRDYHRIHIGHSAFVFA